MSEKKAIHKFKAGDVFDERYILEKLMGSGGFADVWKAKDKDTNSSIALKIYTNLDDDGINDLASEYTRMQNLNHTNILKADYFARWGNIPYLVMKVCEGGSLSKKVGCIDDTELMHVSVSAMLVDTLSKKISLKLLFLSDIFLFPFIRQQVTVLA